MPKGKSPEEVLMGIIWTIITIPFLLVWRGFALATLWEWFLVPMGMVAITVPWAVGILMIFALINPRRVRTNDDEEEGKWLRDTISGTIASFIYPAIVLLFGWVAMGLMPA